MAIKRDKKKTVHGRRQKLASTISEEVHLPIETAEPELEAILDELHKIRLKLDLALNQISGNSSSRLLH